MIARNQSFRYENCANGGHFKGLALARRFTFVTTNDNAGSSVNYRQTHWLNSHALNSVQLKCDMQVGANNLNYTLRSCLLGSWLLAMPEALDILHNSAYTAHIELYKTKQRPILRGGHVFHILPFPDGINLDGAFLLCFHRGQLAPNYNDVVALLPLLGPFTSLDMLRCLCLKTMISRQVFNTTTHRLGRGLWFCSNLRLLPLTTQQFV